MADEWEVIKRNKNFELTAPVSETIPYRSPEKLIKAEEARQQAAEALKQKDARIAATREAYGPFYAGATSAGNEVMQPVLGAGMLATKFGQLPEINKKLTGLSTGMESHVNQLREAYPVETTIGSMVPYMATGPMAEYAYMKGISKLAPGFWTQQMGRTIPSSVIPGMVEGGLMAGLNPYQSGIQGGLLGAGGNLVGQLGLTPFSKGATNLNAYQKDMINRAKELPIANFERKSLYDYMMPGAKTGNTGPREIDDALLSNPDAANALGWVTAPTRATINKEVYENAGMVDTLGKNLQDNNYNLTGAQWKQHKRVLGKRYDSLEARSRPRYDMNIGLDMVTARRAFNDLVDPFDQDVNINAKNWAADFEKKVNNMIDPQTGEIDITAWKGLTNTLKSKMNALNKTSLKDEVQTATLSYAQDMREILRDMMRNGARGTGLANEWAINDNRFALTKFLEENKVIDQGNINAKRLFGALQTKSPDALGPPSTNPWSQAGNAAELGNYVDEMRDATLGMRGYVNTLMGSRQGKKGVFGSLVKHGTKYDLTSGLGASQYVARTPRKGLLRLPEETPLLIGGPTASATARGLFLERDQAR